MFFFACSLFRHLALVRSFVRSLILTRFDLLVGPDNALAQRGGGEGFVRRGVPPLVFQVEVTTRLLSAIISAQLTARSPTLV